MKPETKPHTSNVFNICQIKHLKKYISVQYFFDNTEESHEFKVNQSKTTQIDSCSLW